MTNNTTTLWLPPSAIEPNPFNPRRNFPEQEILELAASIKEQGLLQPPLVRPLAKKHKGITHQLVLGERRWRAVTVLDLELIEVRCKAMTDYESSQAAYTENIQREDLTDFEDAGGLLIVMKQAEKAGNPLSVHNLQKMFGKSETFIRNRLNLFNLKPDVQEMTQRHRSVLSSAYKINTVADKEVRQELIERVDAGASFKAIESAVEKYKADAAWKRDSQAPPDNTTRSALRAQQNKETESLRALRAALEEDFRY